jgi:hypothetical protein
MMKPIKTGSPLSSSNSVKKSDATSNKLIDKVRKIHNPHEINIFGEDVDLPAELKYGKDKTNPIYQETIKIPKTWSDASQVVNSSNKMTRTKLNE